MKIIDIQDIVGKWPEQEEGKKCHHVDFGFFHTKPKLSATDILIIHLICEDGMYDPKEMAKKYTFRKEKTFRNIISKFIKNEYFVRVDKKIYPTEKFGNFLSEGKQRYEEICKKDPVELELDF